MIAHRGASRARRENTVEAFAHAVDLGADGVEFDVRLSLDGVAVVHHDACVDGGQSIAETAAADLPDHLPSLAEALDQCRSVLANVEIKNSPRSKHYDHDMEVVGLVVDELRARPDQQFTVSSFDLATIDAVRAADPALITAHLVDRGDSTQLLRRMVRHGHQIAHPDDLLVDEVFVAQARDLGVEVNVWTVDDPERMAEFIALGVDGIITNVPDVARSGVDAAEG
ncbi:MAG: glycerophosphodiester phosphodiesterase [Actinomycetota bacterium]|nr:glycerophosphodiester phosphodiesterase [Actinomycetota bacterium]